MKVFFCCETLRTFRFNIFRVDELSYCEKESFPFFSMHFIFVAFSAARAFVVIRVEREAGESVPYSSSSYSAVVKAN